jgi:hypothetical protein
LLQLRPRRRSIFPAVVGIMGSSMSLGVAIGYMAAGAYLR